MAMISPNEMVNWKPSSSVRSRYGRRRFPEKPLTTILPAERGVIPCRIEAPLRVP